MEQVKRTDLEEQAEQSLRNNIFEYLNLSGLSKQDHDLSSIFRYYLDCGFLSMTAPTEDPPMMSFMTMDSLKNYNSGRSIKPGNIRLNIKDLIDSIPSMVELAISIATEIPILQVCAALNLWKSLREIITVEISKEQAFVIVSLWKNCDSKHRISIDKGLKAVNALLKKYGEIPISNTKYNQLLDSLESIQCIEIENGVIWLREWISKKYIDKI